MATKINHILRYPVKSLTAEKISKTRLVSGCAIRNDRRFGLLLDTSVLNAATYDWMPKTKFLSLMRNERLAALETHFDDTTNMLTVLHQSRQVAHGKLTDHAGRTNIEDFFKDYLGDDISQRPRIIESTGNHVFSDHKRPVLSLLNLASIKELEKHTLTPINPMRFRANLWLEGLAPWEEFNWLGYDIKINNAILSVTERIDRCAATNVNPNTAQRDLNIVKSLQKNYNHVDMGIFARVSIGGIIGVGDRVLREKPTTA